MIHNFNITNFKSHSNTNLDLSKINILTGRNGSGKTSVIQSLLLLRQSFQKSILDKGLELNGDLCNIGVAEDALFLSAMNNIIEFTINDFKWSFVVNEKKLSDTFLKIKNPNNYELEISLFNNNFQYISAFRNEPLHNYKKDTYMTEKCHQISIKEGRCELIAHYLDFFRNSPVTDISLKKNKKDQYMDLIIQVEKWLRDIIPEINIHVESYDSYYKISYSFNRENKPPTNKFKSTNVSFGISYALPIIIAALHSPKDSIVLIENPESSIHPDGQSKLMELICKAAKTGIQFIIETHSDHIINGLLIATKKKIINPEDSKIYFFDKNIASQATKILYLPVLPGGKIHKPPKGFFDRIDQDMKFLL